MFYNQDMDSLEKLANIHTLMQVEDPEPVGKSQPAAAAGSPPVAAGCSLGRPTKARRPDEVPRADGLPISYAVMPNGRCMPILKTLRTSACERNCYYCACRAGRDFRRQTFKAEELAGISMQLWKSGKVQGVFLSSGIIGGGVRAQDGLLDTAEILRHKLGYRGYLHLKIMPGAEKDQILRGMQLANRVSVNLEAPSERRLAGLAPQKVFLDELLTRLRWIEEIRREEPAHLGWNGHWPSSTTQFVVGAAGESDLELLQTTAFLQERLRLARVYYSAFNPIEDTPLVELPPTDPWREHRLYQASFLLRDYGFQFEEMPFDPHGNLPLQVDPKLAWARETLLQTPVEVNQADFSELLRVPGIGPRGARSILNARQRHRLRRLEDLRALGIITGRAAPFLLINGKRPPLQLSLF